MSGSPVERLMREQLQAMNELFAKQLEAVNSVRMPAASAANAPGPTAPAKGAGQPPASLSASLAVSNPAPTVASASARSSVTKTAAASTREEFKPFGPYKPPQKGHSGGVTPQQEEGLQKLIEIVYAAYREIEGHHREKSRRTG